MMFQLSDILSLVLVLSDLVLLSLFLNGVDAQSTVPDTPSTPTDPLEYFQFLGGVNPIILAVVVGVLTLIVSGLCLTMAVRWRRITSVSVGKPKSLLLNITAPSSSLRPTKSQHHQQEPSSSAYNIDRYKSAANLIPASSTGASSSPGTREELRGRGGSGESERGGGGSGSGTGMIPQDSQFDLDVPGDYTHNEPPMPSASLDTTTLVGGQPLSLPGFLEISMNDIRQGVSVGKGGSGTIYLCDLMANVDTRRESDTQYVVKIMKAVTSEEKNQKQLAAFQQEIALMYHFSNHPNFVKFVAYIHNPRAIVMRFYSQGSLTKLVNRKMDAPLDRWAISCCHLAIDILVGLAELHRCQIVHNDIKPGNVLIEKDRQLRRYVGLLCDFSISSVNGNALMGVKEFHAAKVRGASWAYAAPEVLAKLYLMEAGSKSSQQSHSLVSASDPLSPNSSANRDDNYKADVYSFAITMFEALTRGRAWGRKGINRDLAKMISNGFRPEWPAEVETLRKENAACKKLCEAIEDAWRDDPKRRPTSELLARKLKA